MTWHFVVLIMCGLVALSLGETLREEFERFKEEARGALEKELDQFKEETKKTLEEEFKRFQEVETENLAEIRQLRQKLESSNPSAAFSVRLSQTTSLADSALVFDMVDLNIGDGYDEFTGVFRPPIDGAYLLTFYATATNGASGPAYMKRNDIILCETHIEESAGWVSGVCSAVAQLSTTDSVFVSGLSSDPAEILGQRSGFVGHIVSDNLTV